MLISDTIAAFIEEMLDNCGGTLEIKRNDLAKRLGCVPSQINYVVSSRFTPEKGYIIESRRGGGGYLRIVRKVLSEDELLAKIFNSVHDTIEESACSSILDALYTTDIITAREKRLIRACISQTALSSLSKDEKDACRADIVRQVLLTLMQ